jgi:hypothetical protein
MEHQAEEQASRTADKVGTLRSGRPKPNRHKSVAEPGLEPARASDNDTNELDRMPKRGDAESGAVSKKLSDCDSDLRDVLSAWPNFSAPLKTCILNMVRRARAQW